MNALEMPQLTVLHDTNHGDVDRLRLNAGIPSPFEVRSFTDLQETWNPALHPSSLNEAMLEADHLLVHDRLALGGLTPLASFVVQRASILGERRVRVGLFNDNYEYTPSTAASLIGEGFSPYLDQILDTDSPPSIRPRILKLVTDNQQQKEQQ